MLREQEVEQQAVDLRRELRRHEVAGVDDLDAGVRHRLHPLAGGFGVPYEAVVPAEDEHHRDVDPLRTDGELVRAEGELRHPVFGFSLPDPGADLVEIPAEESAPERVASRGWTFARRDGSALVYVGVVDAAPASAHELQDNLGLVVERFAGAVGESPFEMVEHETRWEARHAHAYFVSATEDRDDYHVRVDLFGLRDGRSLQLVSLATTPDRFAELAAGVGLAS